MKKRISLFDEIEAKKIELRKQYPSCSDAVISGLEYALRKGYSKEQLDLLTSYDFRSKVQIRAILNGFDHDLSVEQVKLFATPDYLGSQMEEICRGLISGLSFDQVSLYLSQDFSAAQMKRLRCDLEAGHSIELVKTYALPELKPSEMSEANRQLLRQTRPQVVDTSDYISKLGIRFRADQQQQIHLGICHGLSETQLAYYAHKKISAKQMRQIRLAIENGIADDLLQNLLDFTQSAYRMEILRDAMEHSLNAEQLELLKDKSLTDMHANSIEKAFLANLPFSTVIDYARQDLGGYQLGLVYYAILNNYPESKISLLTSSKISESQLAEFQYYSSHLPPKKRALLNAIVAPASDWLFPIYKDPKKQDIE